MLFFSDMMASDVVCCYGNGYYGNCCLLCDVVLVGCVSRCRRRVAASQSGLKVKLAAAAGLSVCALSAGRTVVVAPAVDHVVLVRGRVLLAVSGVSVSSVSVSGAVLVAGFNADVRVAVGHNDRVLVITERLSRIVDVVLFLLVKVQRLRTITFKARLLQRSVIITWSCCGYGFAL